MFSWGDKKEDEVDGEVDSRICSGEGLKLLLDFRMTELLLVSDPRLLPPNTPRGVK